MLSYHSISRNELRSPSASPRSSPDPELTQKLLSRVQNEFTFTYTDNDAMDTTEPAPQDEDDEIELVLFAAPASAAPEARKVQKIRLESPGAGTGEPGFLVKKPRSYYFADEPTSEQEEEYRASAIDTATIMAMSREPWPGCALPWKVRTISAKGLQKCVLLGHPTQPNQMLMNVEEKEKKRTRKGKKSRIALRNKMRERETKKAEEERLKKEKEEAEREKKTRRNREKKVKKKMRERAKKAAEGVGNEGDSEALDVQEGKDEDSGTEA